MSDTFRSKPAFKMREALSLSFVEFRTNGKLLIPFMVATLPDLEWNRLVQNLLKPVYAIFIRRRTSALFPSPANWSPATILYLRG